jgi:hypothetical protein
MRRFLRENGLSIAALVLFAASLVGQALSGLAVARKAGPMTLGAYLVGGDFIEAVFENWESEFLQMALFVMLTRFLRQKGSSESKSLDGKEATDEDPRKKKNDPNAPWPVRKGGIVLAVYQRSLFIALILLFIGSFFLHGVGGSKKEGISVWSYFATSQFWFESFQNWQSEFLSVATLVLLSIVLRERGSPQSKPIAAPHAETGG